MSDDQLTIATYPWRTIDAAELLRRMHAAEKGLAELEAGGDPNSDALVLDEIEVVGGVLDYNDQCDLAFGRISRLIMDQPQAAHVEDIGELGELGLDVTGLGISGEQVEMALDKARMLITMHEDQAKILDTLNQAGIEPRSTVEAVDDADIVDRVERLALARKAAQEAATA